MQVPTDRRGPVGAACQRSVPSEPKRADDQAAARESSTARAGWIALGLVT